jgi:hypothetical protein
LNAIWHSVVQQAIGQHQPNVQAPDLNIDWDVLRRFLIRSMPEAAYFRYLEWVEAGKK